MAESSELIQKGYAQQHRGLFCSQHNMLSSISYTQVNSGITTIMAIATGSSG